MEIKKITKFKFKNQLKILLLLGRYTIGTLYTYSYATPFGHTYYVYFFVKYLIEHVKPSCYIIGNIGIKNKGYRS